MKNVRLAAAAAAAATGIFTSVSESWVHDAGTLLVVPSSRPHVTVTVTTWGILLSIHMSIMLYHCKTCGTKHEPPTGKKCRHQNDQVNEIDNQDKWGKLMDMMGSIKESVTTVTTRVSNLEQADEEAETGVDEEIPGPVDVGSKFTPKKVSDDVRLQQLVTNRLTELGLDESSDSEDDSSHTPRRQRGEKSGRVKTAGDVVVKEVDWPHYYVYRGADRKAAKYEYLSVQEFAFGYMKSIATANLQTLNWSRWTISRTWCRTQWTTHGQLPVISTAFCWIKWKLLASPGKTSRR